MKGPETAKSHIQRSILAPISKPIGLSFYEKWMSGDGIDVGYGEGYETVLPTARGIEKDDWIGKRLPYTDGALDYVFSSHCLEHIPDPGNAIREFHRVLKIGGFCVIAVPHKFLYEKKDSLPSRYNEDHKRFYTPASLLIEIELSLMPNSYRIRFLEDNDREFDYSIPPEMHSSGCYEIVCIFQKIQPPSWKIK